MYANVYMDLCTFVYIYLSSLEIYPIRMVLRLLGFSLLSTYGALPTVYVMQPHPSRSEVLRDMIT